MEAMLGTAILSIVMVFFASVSVTAFLLMQKAYFETQIAEEVFSKIESREYSDAVISVRSKSDSAVTGGVFSLVELDHGGSGMDHDYIRYVRVDGTEAYLDVGEVTASNLDLLLTDLYTFRYGGAHGNYSAVFYFLKGEK